MSTIHAEKTGPPPSGDSIATTGDIRTTNIERAIALLKASGAGPLIRGSAPRSAEKWESLLKSLQGALRNARRVSDCQKMAARRYAKPQTAGITPLQRVRILGLQESGMSLLRISRLLRLDADVVRKAVAAAEAEYSLALGSEVEGFGERGPQPAAPE